MACDKNTCKVCKKYAQFRAFKKLLPSPVQDSFEAWFDEIDSALENVEMDLATSMLEWRMDGKRYTDETELRYKHRLLEWEEYKNEHQGISND